MINLRLSQHPHHAGHTYRSCVVCGGYIVSRRMLKKLAQQGSSFEADLRFTLHASRFTAAGSA